MSEANPSLPTESAARAEAARHELTPRLPAFLADLETLVHLDSGTYARDDVERVSAWVKARCAGWGAEMDEHPGGDFANSFAATLHGQGRARIALLAHLDTVFPHGTAAARPFRIEGDHALGPGTCDMKAGLLAAIYPVEALRSGGFNGFGRLRLICTTDEEVGAPSSRGFLERQAAGAEIGRAHV